MADGTSGNIYEFTNNNGTLSSNLTLFASGLANPTGLAFNCAGDIFVACPANGTITEITPSGAQSNFATNLCEPFGLAINSTGNLFVSEPGCDDIAEFTPSAVCKASWADVYNPFGLAFDGAGDLFVASQQGDSIVEITPGGVQSTFASVTFPDVLAFQPAPLGVAPYGNQVVLFWSAYTKNVVLQTTTNLASPNWVTVSNGTPIIGITLTGKQFACCFLSPALNQPSENQRGGRHASSVRLRSVTAPTAAVSASVQTRSASLTKSLASFHFKTLPRSLPLCFLFIS